MQEAKNAESPLTDEQNVAIAKSLEPKKEITKPPPRRFGFRNEVPTETKRFALGK